ncbi:hypothetical protein B0A70_03465 [Chryseobacterium piscicola]|uniref:Uncharacterized protein n=1 Tax=Chryseobacterium piscicola TaxID=551459 RepID=A0A2S7KI11_9FLAO|nr:hypothetical protein B0A70_03465 [Chryseobacterium piscicola]
MRAWYILNSGGFYLVALGSKN